MLTEVWASTVKQEPMLIGTLSGEATDNIKRRLEKKLPPGWVLEYKTAGEPTVPLYVIERKVEALQFLP